jgi:hypothetical protein
VALADTQKLVSTLLNAGLGLSGSPCRALTDARWMHEAQGRDRSCDRPMEIEARSFQMRINPSRIAV